MQIWAKPLPFESLIRRDPFDFKLVDVVPNDSKKRGTMKKYDKLHPDRPLPNITSHVFRHTFCTNMANVGMNVKTLQYLMGHSDAGVTLNIYTHASYDRAAEQMAKLIDFRDAAGWES